MGKEVDKLVLSAVDLAFASLWRSTTGLLCRNAAGLRSSSTQRARRSRLRRSRRRLYAVFPSAQALQFRSLEAGEPEVVFAQSMQSPQARMAR